MGSRNKIEYKEDCFAFIKENLTEGCEILTECVCNNCSFYKTNEEYEYDILMHSINVRTDEK